MHNTLPHQQEGIDFRAEVERFKEAFRRNLEHHIAKDRAHATKYDLYLSAAYSVAEHLIPRWIATQQTYYTSKPKRVYYLSMEFLMGRALGNSLINLGLDDACKQALYELGLDLEELMECEVDAALGNGGLGRLAACFLDSLATLGIPSHGYGLRYEFGLFKQKIVDGRQAETPDHWLALPNAWEVVRPEHVFHVRYGGRTERRADRNGNVYTEWLDADDVLAMAYDTPIPAYGRETVNTLRLWSARSSVEFNLDYFNSGDYMAACQKKVLTENITKVLYPNDNSHLGKELRLKQEYFLVSASIQDIVTRFKCDTDDWQQFPELVAIQLNDTHPSLAIPELLRILLDEEGLSWEQAWDISVRTFAYTNHTLLPEALEEWPVDMLGNLLPRHLEIIYLINHHFMNEVAQRHPGDLDILRRMSIIGEEGYKRVRMAFLSIVGSHKVNGVAALHSRLMCETIFHDFATLWPDRFTNKTNGVTPRRWMLSANPRLSTLITDAIGDGWVTDLDRLHELERFVDDAGFQARWRAVKRGNKEAVAELVRADCGVIITPDSLYDIQVKRFHEYKRQLLFALYIVSSYLRIKENPAAVTVPRTCLIGGKAAPGYFMAKHIIHLINRIGEMVNGDPDTRDKLRVAFLPNYRVSLAERLIPAADLSEQISTAGKEASGTGNMKFALNGALTIGTLDGANIEILEEVGEDNIFIFGKQAHEVAALHAQGYRPGDFIAQSPVLQGVLRLLDRNFFSHSEPDLFRPIHDNLVFDDPFFLMADFDAYLATQDRVSEAYGDVERWTRMSILNVARCGKFSSDRTIADYAREIWGATSMDVLAKDDLLTTISCWS